MTFRRKKISFGQNLFLFLLASFILICALGIVWISTLKIPDFNSFAERKVANSIKIYDRTGQTVLYDIHQDVRRTDITFDQMGENIKKATIAIEDSEFYNHQGIRISSTIRAILANLFEVGKTQGGSTITQQLVKNTLLTQKKTYTRKLKEWVLALKIDKSMPKEKILEYYLNENPYGGNIYGIAEAARTYFSKEAKDLSIAEAAYLAAIPQSPTVLSPYGKNKDKLEARKNLVLERMFQLGFIPETEYSQAKTENVKFTEQKAGSIKAPHFVFFIKDYLTQKYGEEKVEKGGLKVITTLDYPLQQKAEQIVKEGALENEKNWGGSNAGLVAIDPKTGQILAMVGSRDYFDKEIDGNFNITTALRQPGSSFKPFIYATAFSKGFNPKTVLFDLPTEFQATCDPYGKALPGHNQANCYMPKNYDDKTVGPITLRDALAQSRNIPAVKLFYLAGLRDSLQTAETLGISTLTDISRYGLTLVIGGGEVSLLEMTSAYSVFANSGIKNSQTGILKIEDLNGQTLEEYVSKGQEVLNKNVALTVSDILADNQARIPTFGANSPLYIPGKEVAAKTGTTNSNKDAWIIGYTPTLAVGVWAGNNDNKPMKKGGSAVAGPIWNKFMTEALKTLPNENFEKPDLSLDRNLKPVLRGSWQGNEGFWIDKISGKLATADTPEETLEEKVITNVHTILYWLNKEDILGASPENPNGDAQFRNWEIPVQNWWAQNSWRYPIITNNQKPNQYDNVHLETNKPQIEILEPNGLNIYELNQKIPLKISSTGRYPLKKIDLFVNDTFLDTIQTPFNYSLILAEIDNLKSNNQLKIIGYDSAFNKTETMTDFKVNK